jgi:hypothetical protein
MGKKNKDKSKYVRLGSLTDRYPKRKEFKIRIKSHVDIPCKPDDLFYYVKEGFLEIVKDKPDLLIAKPKPHFKATVCRHIKELWIDSTDRNYVDAGTAHELRSRLGDLIRHYGRPEIEETNPSANTEASS